MLQKTNYQTNKKKKKKKKNHLDFRKSGKNNLKNTVGVPCLT